uniref:CCHC-type domain-containing protein n=1 Tax=Ditylenchus dipsaci TaxID=166011 RepID=A0A915DTL8_9BILA
MMDVSAFYVDIEGTSLILALPVDVILKLGLKSGSHQMSCKLCDDKGHVTADCLFNRTSGLGAGFSSCNFDRGGDAAPPRSFRPGTGSTSRDFDRHSIPRSIRLGAGSTDAAFRSCCVGTGSHTRDFDRCADVAPAHSSNLVACSESTASRMFAPEMSTRKPTLVTDTIGIRSTDAFSIAALAIEAGQKLTSTPMNAVRKSKGSIRRTRSTTSWRQRF